MNWRTWRVAEAFGVREDTVRLWRSDVMKGGVDALRATAAPVADRPNWTIPRLRAEIEARERGEALNSERMPVPSDERRISA